MGTTLPPTSHEPSHAEVTGHRQDPVVQAFSEHLPAKEPSASNSLEPLKALTTAQLTPCKSFEALPSNLLCIFWSDLNQTSRNYPLGTAEVAASALSDVNASLRTPGQQGDRAATLCGSLPPPLGYRVWVWVKEKARLRRGWGRKKLKSCFSLKNSALYYKLLKCFFFEYKYKYVQSLTWIGILLSSSSISYQP